VSIGERDRDNTLGSRRNRAEIGRDILALILAADSSQYLYILKERPPSGPEKSTDKDKRAPGAEHEPLLSPKHCPN
jgi:hypothetical protein